MFFDLENIFNKDGSDETDEQASDFIYDMVLDQYGNGQYK